MVTQWQYYIENNLIFLQQNYEWYIGLSTTLPTITGTNITEPTDPNYQRVKIIANSTTFNSATTGILTNKKDITIINL